MVHGLLAYRDYFEYRTNGLAMGMICVPEKVSPKMLVDVVRNYIQRKPESYSFPTRALAYSALSESYGCKALPQK